MTHPGVPEDIRGTYAAIGHPAIIDHLRELGVTAVELLPVHQFVNDSHLVDQGLSNYWGYNTIGFLAPHNAYASTGTRGQQATEFKAMVRGAARGQHRSDLGRGLQPHRRRQRARPDDRLPRHRQRRLLPAGRRRTSALLRHHRHRQQPADAQPARAAADHGLAALLGAGDARRRVPVRPGRDPGPAVPRGRQAVGVLRHHPAGPGDLPGQADRRALGSRRRRLPGRQLPAAVDRVERQVPRHGPRLLARRAGLAGRVRVAGSPARAISTPTPTAGRPRRSTSSSPTTASPCAISCPTTRSTTRPTARAATTARATTAPGTAASRARPTTQRSTRCGCGSSATSSPR